MMGIHRETSGAILIDSFGRLLFQQRDNNPEILYPGMIGLFGGHREGEETFLDCVVREIHEEISYFVPAERFVHLVSYKGMACGGTFHCEIFVTNSLPTDQLVITEGTLLTIRVEDFAEMKSKFSPSARFAMAAFLKNETPRPSGPDRG
jgi:8-oxo-dGTP diphosphatase